MPLLKSLIASQKRERVPEMFSEDPLNSLAGRAKYGFVDLIFYS